MREPVDRGFLAQPCENWARVSETLARKNYAKAEATNLLRARKLEKLGRMAGLLAWLFMLAGPVSAVEAINIVFTCHSATTNSFWQAVKLGFDDACAKVGANGQFIFRHSDGRLNRAASRQHAGGHCPQAGRFDYVPGRQ